MSELSLANCRTDCITLIEKPEYYKIKYKDTFTFLNLILHLPQVSYELSENNRMNVCILDAETRATLSAVDDKFSELTGTCRKILRKDRIEFSQNPVTLGFFREKRESINLRIKCVRKNPSQINHPVLYIL